jgi:hypothetical protein
MQVKDYRKYVEGERQEMEKDGEENGKYYVVCLSGVVRPASNACT